MPWESHQAKTDQDKQTKQTLFITKDGERSEDAVPSSAQWIDVKMLLCQMIIFPLQNLDKVVWKVQIPQERDMRMEMPGVMWISQFFHVLSFLLMFQLLKKIQTYCNFLTYWCIFFSRDLFVAKDVATWGDGELCTSTKPERPGANSRVCWCNGWKWQVLLQIGPFFFSKIHLFIQFFWGVTWFWWHHFHQCRSVSLILVFVSSSTICRMSRMPSPFAFVGCALIHHSLWTGRMELQ